MSSSEDNSVAAAVVLELIQQSARLFPNKGGTARKAEAKVMCGGREWSGVERSGLDWSGVEWSGVEWSGVEWSGVEWSGVEWSGVEWSGVEWSSA